MDSGLTVRPTTSVAQTGFARPEPVQVRQAVATELAASQAVTAAAETAQVRNDVARTLPSEPSITHDVIIDPATREVIFRVVDVRSGHVIDQVPNQAQLQMAAYTQAVQRSLEHGKTLTEAEAKADLDVAV